MTYSPQETAVHLSVSAPTLRRWAMQFGALLSPEARMPAPGHGRQAQRRFSDGDLAVLRRAKAMLDSGLSVAQVSSELALPPPPSPIEPGTPALTALQVAHRRELAARDEALAGLRREIAARDEIIAGLRRELDAARESATTATALEALRTEMAHLTESLGSRWFKLGR